MTTETPTFTITPLSEFRPQASLGEFVTQLQYHGRGARARFEADHMLIDALHNELRRAAGVDRLPTVGELNESQVFSCIERTEERFPDWRLAGDESESVFARLDKHFAPEQARWRGTRLEQEALLAEKARGTAEGMRQIAEWNAGEGHRRWLGMWGIPTGDA